MKTSYLSDILRLRPFYNCLNFLRVSGTPWADTTNS